MASSIDYRLFEATTDYLNSSVEDVAPARSFAALLPPFLLLILVTCISNIIVMLCTRTYSRLKTVSNMYVFSLAVADLIVGISVMLGMLVYTLYGLWPLGHATCTLWIVLDFSCCTVSMIHLCLIAFDRYEALTNPIEYRQKHTTSTALKRIAGAWIIGVLVWMPACVSIQAINIDILPEQDCFFVPSNLYVILQAIFVYYLPIIGMIYLYMMCLHVLRKRFSKIAMANAKPSGISSE